MAQASAVRRRRERFTAQKLRVHRFAAKNAESSGAAKWGNPCAAGWNFPYTPVRRRALRITPAQFSASPREPSRRSRTCT